MKKRVEILVGRSAYTNEVKIGLVIPDHKGTFTFAEWADTISPKLYPCTERVIQDKYWNNLGSVEAMECILDVIYNMKDVWKRWSGKCGVELQFIATRWENKTF